MREMPKSGLRPTKGFALILTIVLLAFLVLLLLALATVTRIETGMAGNIQRQAQARQNALLALDIALGQLQRMAGADQRVTASADAFSSANPHYAGVWNAGTNDVAPITWLVSGNEGSDPLAVTPAVDSGDRVELVGRQTSGQAGSVLVPRQPIMTTGLPGQKAAVITGHYAWWIGDQGIKAPVVQTEASASVDYAPYDSAEVRSRLRQQIGLGAQAAAFDSTDGQNAPFLRSIVAYNQVSFLRKPDSAPVGPVTIQRNYHIWSPGNHTVLASTRPGGLREDLSLAPGLLGNAFAAWADYSAYMENPLLPGLPAPSPAYSADPLRRRHRLTPAFGSAGAVHGVWPLPTYFLLTFNVRTQGGSSAVKPIEVRARWMLTLWNPYTSALVPENLRIAITGLPTALQVVDDTLGTVPAVISLPAVYGSPLRINLPWDHASVPDPDRQSWLPGRVYTWTALEDGASAAPVVGYLSKFYSRNLSADAGQGVQRAGSTVALDGDDVCHLAVTGVHALTLKLFVVRSGGDVLLATFHSPEYAGFSTTPRKLSAGTYQFSYLFRLAESIDTPAAPETWLAGSAGDIRKDELGPDAFVPGANGNRPELYENYTTISSPDRLCDRAANAFSYNEDTPVFELPRSPLLSLGQLQHLQLAGARPWAIGNSWGGTALVNGIPAGALFDRFFFSGLAPGVTPPPGGPPPNSLLQLLPRKRDGSPLVPADLAVLSPPGKSAKHLLQGGAFNLNSVSRDAWLAMLRSVRFTATSPFVSLDAAAASGTAGDSATRSFSPGGAQFFRFSQSAQETWKADEPQGGSTYAASTTTPPAAANNHSTANTHLFRRGFRTLSASQLEAFAEAIIALMRQKQAASGPWRSLEEFLNPVPLFLDAAGHQISLLEKAIEEVGLNAGVEEFSSQWLTQADVMTALAPVLFSRSDTFVIRTYGDVFNPVTGVSEGRAWSEAMVQRLPAYFDSADPEETPPSLLNPVNARFGRRFKIIHFRWLTLADI